MDWISKFFCNKYIPQILHERRKSIQLQAFKKFLDSPKSISKKKKLTKVTFIRLKLKLKENFEGNKF